MMGRLRDITANEQQVEQMLGLLKATPAHRYMPRLRKYAREKLDEDYPNDQLYTDLMRLRSEVRSYDNEELEEAIGDVMDFLTGVCAPEALLY